MSSSTACCRSARARRRAQFLRWFSDDHLVFLGYREYDFVHEAEDDDVVVVVPGTGLGLLRTRRTEEPHRSSVTPRPAGWSGRRS
jgi:NAD-specific glutamate dehydrogenase